ncbi:hypothetical protein GGR56DRAFT_649111 [Xylariaceae sp. FL0804]|nr:hypothetical protein GGR56DRAFT_649111 [Xylariaceae sp. FL0804]
MGSEMSLRLRDNVSLRYSIEPSIREGSCLLIQRFTFRAELRKKDKLLRNESEHLPSKISKFRICPHASYHLLHYRMKLSWGLLSTTALYQIEGPGTLPKYGRANWNSAHSDEAIGYTCPNCYTDSILRMQVMGDNFFFAGK